MSYLKLRIVGGSNNKGATQEGLAQAAFEGQDVSDPDVGVPLLGVNLIKGSGRQVPGSGLVKVDRRSSEGFETPHSQAKIIRGAGFIPSGWGNHPETGDEIGPLDMPTQVDGLKIKIRETGVRGLIKAENRSLQSIICEGRKKQKPIIPAQKLEVAHVPN